MNVLVRQLLSSSRYFIIVAVVGSFLASATALLYGGLATAVIVLNTFRSLSFTASGAKVLSVDLVTMIDLFLIGTVLYIIAVGLYELFIDPGLPMPRWLKITTLDDLKERLLGVVGVLLAVTFLGSAVTWNGSTDILSLGIAVAAVLGVVTLTIAVMARTHTQRDGERDQPWSTDDH
jgi:uncharacterized membrane protein YqhA